MFNEVTFRRVSGSLMIKDATRAAMVGWGEKKEEQGRQSVREMMKIQ